MASFLSKLTASGSAVWHETTEPSGSPQEQFGRDNSQVTRTFLIKNTDRLDFLSECYPGVGTISGKHPYWGFLYVDSVGFAPLANSGTEFVESLAGNVQEAVDIVATVTYSPWQAETFVGGGGGEDPPEQEPQDDITGDISFTSEVISLPGHSLKWASSGDDIKSENVNAGAMVTMMQFSILLPRRSAIPWVPIRANINKVNEFQFWGAAPETLLYNGPNISFKFSNTGQRQFDIAHSFTEKRIHWVDPNTGVDVIFGWNHIWNPEKDINGNAIGWDKPVLVTWAGFNASVKYLYTLSDRFVDLLI